MPTNRIPEELRALSQWVLWRTEERNGKPTKVPYQARTWLYRARSDDPRTWAAVETAIEMRRHHAEHVNGIGFVFSPDDPYTGIDLDNIWQSDADEGAEWGMRVLERFGDTYSEASPSDKGVKIWCKAKALRCGRWNIRAGAIEVYSEKRFFTVTGRHAGVLAVTDHQHDVELLVANLDQGRHQPKAPAIPNVIPQGQRHPTLVSLAGSMWRRGVCAAAIEAALLKTNEEQCDPPHSADHIHKIVESMQRWRR